MGALPRRRIETGRGPGPGTVDDAAPDVAAVLPAVPVFAAVLPEERADALYHYYTGGGVQVDGPSILVRKNIGKSVSLSADYYVDTVSSASIDVLSQASRLDEFRMHLDIPGDKALDLFRRAG